MIYICMNNYNCNQKQTKRRQANTKEKTTKEKTVAIYQEIACSTIISRCNAIGCTYDAMRCNTHLYKLFLLLFIFCVFLRVIIINAQACSYGTHISISIFLFKAHWGYRKIFKFKLRHQELQLPGGKALKRIVP